MKQKSFLTKILAVLLATAFLLAYPANVICYANDDSSQSDEYAGMTAEEKQAAIREKIKDLIPSFHHSERNQRKQKNI